MEIINCAVSNRHGCARFFNTLAFIRPICADLPKFFYARSKKFSTEQKTFSANVAAFRVPSFRAKQEFSFRGFLINIGDLADALVRNLHLISLLLCCIVIPYAVKTASSYLSSFANPLVLEDVPAEELEILNKIMADFALERSNEFDENGDVLNADGFSYSPSEINFRQPVSYRTYVVQSGDTILGITRRFGLSNISTLIAVNDIANVRRLRFGQKLVIPSMDGLVHTVKSGDSLNALSVQYHVPVEDLLDVNDLESHNLLIGAKLFIPGAKLSSDAIRLAMGEMFIYPLKGKWRRTSLFGFRSDPFTGVRSFHTGLDMAMPTGSPVYASMSGKVAAVGFTNVYGNYIIINHGNGYQTLYAHLSRSLAKTGDRIDQGEKIGLVGSTGYSTGPHLHFTVYKNGKLVDPLTVLKN